MTALCTNPLRLSPTEGDQLLTAGGETSFLKLFSLKPTEVVDGKKKALSLEEQLKDGEAAAALPRPVHQGKTAAKQSFEQQLKALDKTAEAAAKQRTALVQTSQASESRQ